MLKFGIFRRPQRFDKIFHLILRLGINIKWKISPNVLWPSQKAWTLLSLLNYLILLVLGNFPLFFDKTLFCFKLMLIWFRKLKLNYIYFYWFFICILYSYEHKVMQYIAHSRTCIVHYFDVTIRKLVWPNIYCQE